MEEKVKRKSEIDLKHIKPTDLKNNVRIYPPVEATKHSEAAILTQEHAIRECMMDYYLNNPDAKTPLVLREGDWDRDRIWRILFTAAERRANIVVDELRGKRTSHHQHVCILSHLIFLYVYHFEITDSRLIVLTDIISVCDTVTGALERRHLDGDIKFGDRHNAERGN